MDDHILIHYSTLGTGKSRVRAWGIRTLYFVCLSSFDSIMPCANIALAFPIHDIGKSFPQKVWVEGWKGWQCGRRSKDLI